MQQYKYGFIGTGNMGGALAKTLCKTVAPASVLLANRTPAKAEALAVELGCAMGNNESVAQECRYILLGVKPQMMSNTLALLRPVFDQRTDRFILVTMAAGLTMETISGMAGRRLPVIRIMPNTPCAVGAGLILYTANDLVTEEELTSFTADFAAAGVLDRLEEHLIDAASAVAGCGPAFLCQVMEALSDGGVACGLPRKKALLYAAQMVQGTAKLLLETGEHPAVLKDAVCSPAGSTIAGVRALERAGVRGAMMDAVIAAAERSKELG